LPRLSACPLHGLSSRPVSQIPSYIVSLQSLTDHRRAKKDKYPYGYPGDAFGPNSTPHYECHECKTKYPPDTADGTECAKCSHKKCESCPRLTPRKVDPEPDPEIWKRVQEKLGALDIKDK
jgi:hypothetical protein